MMSQITSEEKTLTDSKVVNHRRSFYPPGWGFIGVFMTSVIGASIRFFSPRILYESHRKM